MAIVLDTNVVRSLGAGELSPAGLEAARRDGISIHISDVAGLELLHALLVNKMPWEHWRNARDTLRRVLDNEEPVFLGGRPGLARAGLIGKQLVSAAEISQLLLTNRERWEAAGRAPSREALARLFDSDDLRATVLDEKQRWVEQFTDFDHAVKKEVPDLPGLLSTGDGWTQATQVFVDWMLKAMDLADSADGVPASVRFDAFLRVHVLLHLRRLKKKDAYNPEKDANDAFDHSLLRQLAFPTAICTSERGIFADLEAARSWQRRWVVRPDDLLNRDVRETLVQMAWPRSG